MANPSRHAVRLREMWDQRLRVSERELLCELAGVAPAHAEFDWAALPSEDARRINFALRDLAALGREVEYALGYSRVQDRPGRKRASDSPGP